jgi:hypothetical protein
MKKNRQIRISMRYFLTANKINFNNLYFSWNSKWEKVMLNITCEYKKLNRKLEMRQHKSHWKQGLNSGRVSSSCSTSGTYCVTLVTNPVISHKWTVCHRKKSLEFWKMWTWNRWDISMFLNTVFVTRLTRRVSLV